ncbi:MAG TPA: hypothetical protein VLT45_20295 [Kofleriaceae bacterium]|nr:hypothetical protein [Kofleriaceae bacterium]
MRCLGVLAALLVVPAAAMADPCAMPLTFTPGHSALAPASKEALAPALDALRSHRELKAHIVAPADPLSKKRGDVVKWFLVDSGIEVDRIDVASGNELQLQLVGCTRSLEQRVSTQLAPVRPAVAAPPPPLPTGSLVADASGLAELLAGDDDQRRATLDASLATSHAPAVKIGHDDVGFRGSEPSVHTVTAPGGLRLASATIVETTGAHHDALPQRTTLETGPTLSATQPTGQKVKLDGHQLRALSRCYRRIPGVRPKDTDDVELTFAVDRSGKVIEPVVISDEDALVGCIGSVMVSWKFPALKKSRSRIWLSVVLTAG